MKITFNGKEILNITETMKKVICNDINESLFEEDISRRLRYIIEHKYEQCFKRLKAEWEGRLAERVESIPTNQDKLAELIFSQPDYKCRKQRDAHANES